MTTRLVLAWIHLLALGVGLAGVWSRARALGDSLRDQQDAGAVRRAFLASASWNAAIVVWLATGLWWLVGGTAKGSSYYLDSHAFLIKSALFAALVALEIWPTTTLLRWRARKAVPNPRDVGRIEVVSYVQCALVAAIVLASVRTAHGDGAGEPAGTGPDSLQVTPATGAPATGAAGAPATSAPGAPQAFDDDAPDPVEPSGTETVTADDLALLTRQIAMPLDAVDPTTLRSNFDERRGGGTRQHQALDIMAPRGTPIRSVTKGRALKLFTSGNGGLMVYAADSSERFIFLYAHLDAYVPGLRDDAPLERGQIIGYVGSTGNASPTAPHLHFAIARSADVKRWSRGKPIDPLPVLVAGTAQRAGGR